MRPISLWRGFLFRRLAPFLDDSKRLVLMGDWNAILDPKIDKVGRGTSRLGRCESSLVGLMTRHDLVDRFRLDHPGWEMWTWLDSSPSAKDTSAGCFNNPSPDCSGEVEGRWAVDRSASNVRATR